MLMRGALLVAMLAGGAVAQEPEWLELERPLLADPVQLTFDTRFSRAGEAYFSPAYDEEHPKWIIFQATDVPPEGQPRSDHYDMYIARLRWDGDRIVGIGEPARLNPEGSANTCGWFHPTEEGVVLFGSTLAPPAGEDVPGYQRGTGRYRWAFPDEMDIVVARFEEDASGEARVLGDPEPMFEVPGYTAEGSWSPDGRFVLYGQVDVEKSNRLGRADADLWIYDTHTDEHTLVVEAEGYDGGPFFDATGTRITYRSDRRGDNLLQLFTAELAFDRATGGVVGAVNERQVTDNQDVNWAPFFHPNGEFLVFTGSQAGHFNYELFAVEARPVEAGRGDGDATPRMRRVTHAPGFDGLAVFTPDGSWMMWTSQRAGHGVGEGGASSQLWVARVRPTRDVTERFLEGPRPAAAPVPNGFDDQN